MHLQGLGITMTICTQSSAESGIKLTIILNF